jgi:hypothetical protein
VDSPERLETLKSRSKGWKTCDEGSRLQSECSPRCSALTKLMCDVGIVKRRDQVVKTRAEKGFRERFSAPVIPL